MDQRKKSKALSEREQAAIATYAVNNPNLSDREVAATFGCNAAQVRYARNKAEAAKLSVPRNGISEEGTAEVTAISDEQAEIMERQLHFTLAQIDADKKMRPNTRAILLGSLARTRRVLRETSLQGKLKATDAGVLLALIRMFRPEATEEQCIEIYWEAVERWKVSR